MSAWEVGTFGKDRTQNWIHEFLTCPSKEALLDVFEGRFALSITVRYVQRS